MLHQINLPTCVGVLIGVVLGWTIARITSVDLQTGTTVVLVVVTAIYVFLTHEISQASEASARASRDMADRMPDSIRPVVVPVISFENVNLGKDGYVRIVHFSQVGRPPPASGDLWEPLFLQNVGLGPAINVGIVLDNPNNLGIIPNGKGGARPIAAGSKEQAYQWAYPAGALILEGAKLTITYDDMFGHHFKTTALRALHDWYDVCPQRTWQPGPPRQYPKPII